MKLYKDMKVKIKPGAAVEIGSGFERWSLNKVFIIDKIIKQWKCRLIANGYGKLGAYGRGPVYADINDLVAAKGE